MRQGLLKSRVSCLPSPLEDMRREMREKKAREANLKLQTPLPSAKLLAEQESICENCCIVVLFSVGKGSWRFLFYVRSPDNDH